MKPGYKAAAIESAQQFSNSKYNEIPFHEYYAKEEHNNLMLETWKGTIELMLSHTDSSITFKDVKLSDYHATKDELLKELQNI